MNSLSRKWIGALLLPLTVTAWAAEPSPGTNAPTATAAEAEPGAAAAVTSLAGVFDLRGASVREIVRVAASTLAASDYRVEPTTATLRREGLPAKKKKPAKPRLRNGPPPCDGFISCGVDTLLGQMSQYTRALAC